MKRPGSTLESNNVKSARQEQEVEIQPPPLFLDSIGGTKIGFDGNEDAVNKINTPKNWKGLNTFFVPNHRYGWHKELPVYTHFWSFRDLADKINFGEFVYPTDEEVQAFRQFDDLKIFDLWIRKYDDDPIDTSKPPYLGLTDVRAKVIRRSVNDQTMVDWMTTNYNVLWNYFNTNQYQKLNFYGMSKQPDGPPMIPAYILESPLELPVAFKHYMLIMFTARFVAEFKYNGAVGGLNFIWRSPPKKGSTPSLQGNPRKPDLFKPYWEGKESVTASFIPGDDYLHKLIGTKPEMEDFMFPAKDSQTLKFMNMILQHPYIDKAPIRDLWSRAFPSGMAVWADVEVFASGYYWRFVEEAKNKTPKDLWELYSHPDRLARIKSPDLSFIFKDVDKMDSITAFKELWKRTAIGDSALDQLNEWFHKAQQGTLLDPNKKPHALTNVDPRQWPPKISVREIQTIEDKLLAFMLLYPPPRLKRPPFNFWKETRLTEEYIHVFEEQWADYLEWSIQNVGAWGKPNYVKPGEPLKNGAGQRMFLNMQKQATTEGVTKKGATNNPLINIYPDYGLIDYENRERAWYRRVPLFWTYVGDFIWGSEFWGSLFYAMKAVFEQVIQVLKQIVATVVDVVEDIAKTVLPEFGPFLLVGGLVLVAVVGGSSFISGVGNELGQRLG